MRDAAGQTAGTMNDPTQRIAPRMRLFPLRLVQWLLVSLCLLSTARAAPDLPATTGQTLAVAEPYHRAYMDRAWDTLEPLLAESATFQDPTAEMVFGGQRHVGKPALMKLFREGYASITQMRFEPLRTVASGQHVLFEGTLAWTLRLQSGKLVSSRMPIVTWVRVQDGLVTEHIDLADYRPFVDALRAARARP
jgi:ketosteroid isomerase-like protein